MSQVGITIIIDFFIICSITPSMILRTKKIYWELKRFRIRKYGKRKLGGGKLEFRILFYVCCYHRCTWNCC